MQANYKYWIFAMLLPAIGYCQQELKLHYDKPATQWTEALPIGNGRLGAMVFGRINEEMIQLNEVTLWSGGPVQKNVNPDAFPNLNKAREALFAGDYASANELVKKMQGLYTESYMPLGDLILKQDFGNASPSFYNRELNIQDGIATTNFVIDGISYKREIFASAPGECIIMRLSASKPKKLSVSIDTKSQLKSVTIGKDNSLFLDGKAPAHVDPSYLGNTKNPVDYTDSTSCRGMRFEAIIKPIQTDGTLDVKDNTIYIQNATEILIIVSGATSFNGFEKCPDKDGRDERQLAASHLAKALGKKYSVLLEEHLKDFHRFFNRVSFILNTDEENKSSLPTDERLASYTKGDKDANLEALYFQYGRYLLISSSRTKDAPANLQGIWNKEIRPPWSSNYTTNINVEMNYWPVETANLSELFSPLNDLIKNLSVTGSETAQSYYHTKGWVVHHNSDIWATSNPVGGLGNGDPMWANWYMGANWLSRHLWEHYQFRQDKKYLKSIYPIMKSAA